MRNSAYDLVILYPPLLDVGQLSILTGVVTGRGCERIRRYPDVFAHEFCNLRIACGQKLMIAADGNDVLITGYMSEARDVIEVREAAISFAEHAGRNLRFRTAIRRESILRQYIPVRLAG